MITTIVISSLITVVGALLGAIPFLLNVISFGYIPTSITVLPFGIDAVLTSGFGYVHYISAIMPPVGIILDGFVFVIFWKLGLKAVAMIPFVRGMLHK